MKHFILLIALALAARPAAAQVAADSAKITVYGYLDGYYGFDFPHPASTVRPDFFYSHNR